MKTRLNVYFSPDLLRRIEEPGRPQAAVALLDRRGRGRVLPVAGRGGSARGRLHPPPRPAVAADRAAGARRRDLGRGARALRPVLAHGHAAPAERRAGGSAGQGAGAVSGICRGARAAAREGKGLLQEIPNDIFTPGSNTGAARGDDPAVDGRDTTSQRRAVRDNRPRRSWSGRWAVAVGVGKQGPLRA